VLKDLSQTSFLFLLGEFIFESLSSKQRWNEQFTINFSKLHSKTPFGFFRFPSTVKNLILQLHEIFIRLVFQEKTSSHKLLPILFLHLEFHAISFVRYDGHVLDPLANLQLTTGTYYMLASSIKQLAKDLCGGRCVFFLEGGYNLKSLSYSVADTFRALLGDKSLASEFDNPNILYEEPTKKVKQAIQRIKCIHSL
jgi:hypothetical protein